MIMKGRTPLHLPLAGLCTIALVAAATLPAWAISPQAAAQAPPTPPPPPPAATLRQVPSPAPQPVRVQTPQPTVRPRTLEPTAPSPSRRLILTLPDALPAEGRALVDELQKEQAAILDAAQKQVEQRRAATIKALEALQDQLARDGKLDEAVAIRDYLRAGGPSSGTGAPTLRRMR